MLAELERLLDLNVRPMLLSHGGDLEVLSVEDGYVRFKLLGQCAGCPSAYLTTEEVIDVEVRQLDGIKGAVLEQRVSDDLLQQARNILKNHHA